MSKKNDSPQTLSEAIKNLEEHTTSKAKDFGGILEKDFKEVVRAFEELKPFIKDLKEKVNHEVQEKKDHVELKLKQNPWMVVGIAGIFAFILGWILKESFTGGSSSRKDDDQK